MHGLVRFLRVLGLMLVPFIGCGDYDDQGCESPLTSACDGVDCNDENPCTVDECFYNLLTGGPVCLHDAVADGTACEVDGRESICTDGVCDFCIGVVCEDDDLCTRDVCIPATGTCEFPPVVCSDDN
jgi:hypothetical protein